MTSTAAPAQRADVQPGTTLDEAERFVRGQVADADLRRLFDMAFTRIRGELRNRMADISAIACVRTPRAVYTALAGDGAAHGEMLRRLEMAGLLIYMGIDLWDEVMDRELPAIWSGINPDEVALAAVTLFSALAPLALDQPDVPADTRVAMQRTLARGYIAIAAGQRQDLALTGTAAPTSAEAEAAIAGKSGAVFAMLAELAALAAQAPERQITAASALGMALGIAQQLRSDCFDLFFAPHSKDLARGVRTLPLALYLEKLEPQERAAFVEILDQARTEDVARRQVRAALSAAGILRACALLTELHVQRARAALALLPAGNAADSQLWKVVEDCSFFEHLTSTTTERAA